MAGSDQQLSGLQGLGQVFDYSLPAPKQPSENYFYNNFNTNLTPSEQKKFNDWVDKASKVRGYNMHEDKLNYDLQGYWKNIGKNSPVGKGHFVDTYKKPNHPTFSNQSQYSGTPNPQGGIFKGGTWTQSADGQWSYMPSPEMLTHTESLQGLRQYMKQVEPDSKLILPSGYQDIPVQAP